MPHFRQIGVCTISPLLAATIRYKWPLKPLTALWYHHFWGCRTLKKGSGSSSATHASVHKHPHSNEKGLLRALTFTNGSPDFQRESCGRRCKQACFDGGLMDRHRTYTHMPGWLAAPVCQCLAGSRPNKAFLGQ